MKPEQYAMLGVILKIAAALFGIMGYISKDTNLILLGILLALL